LGFVPKKIKANEQYDAVTKSIGWLHHLMAQLVLKNVKGM